MSKKRHAAHADERWLLTYADMITLLMALFIVLFSISVVNTSKFEQLKQSLKKSFSGAVIDGGQSILSNGAPSFVVDTANSASARSTDAFADVNQAVKPATSAAKAQAIKSATIAQAAQDKSLIAAQKLIDAKAKALGLQDKVNTTVDERGLVIRLITDKVLFDVGSSVVKPEADPLLRGVTEAIESIPNAIHVDGFTDARPFAGDPYGNWKLSSDRAGNVLYFMLGNGLDRAAHGDDVSFAGNADKALPGTDALAPQNRRVEIVVVRRDLVAQAQKEVSGPIGVNPVGVPSIIPSIAPIPGATTTPTAPAATTTTETAAPDATTSAATATEPTATDAATTDAATTPGASGG